MYIGYSRVHFVVLLLICLKLLKHAYHFLLNGMPQSLETKFPERETFAEIYYIFIVDYVFSTKFRCEFSLRFFKFFKFSDFPGLW